MSRQLCFTQHIQDMCQYTAVLKEEWLLCRSEQGDLSSGCAICVALCPRTTIRCWHGVHPQVTHFAWLLF